MGCIEAVNYTGGTILGVFAGGLGNFDPLNDCIQECGVCCKWDCAAPTGYGTTDLQALFEETYDPLIYSAASCSLTLLASNISHTCDAWTGESGCVTGTPLQKYDVYPFKEGYPTSGVDNYLIKYEATKGYGGESNCGQDLNNGHLFCLEETYKDVEIRYYECISGVLTDKTSDAIETFDLVVFCSGSDTGCIMSSERLTNVEVQSNPTVGTNVNYSYHTYWAEVATESSGWWNVNSPATFPCAGLSGPPGSTSPPGSTAGPMSLDEEFRILDSTPPGSTTPVATGNDCPVFRSFPDGIDDCPRTFPTGTDTTYTCDEIITKSGCELGGANNSAIGVWISGQDCTTLNALGGCSGVV